MTNVISFQVEQFQKLLSGKSLDLPDLSVFLTLVVTEAVLASQVAIPAGLWAYEEGKRRKWWT